IASAVDDAPPRKLPSQSRGHCAHVAQQAIVGAIVLDDCGCSWLALLSRRVSSPLRARATACEDAGKDSHDKKALPPTHGARYRVVARESSPQAKHVTVFNFCSQLIVYDRVGDLSSVSQSDGAVRGVLMISPCRCLRLFFSSFLLSAGQAAMLCAS